MKIGNLTFALKLINQNGNVIDRKYSGWSKEDLLDQFDSRNWNGLSEEDKIYLLTEMGKVYAEERGIKNAPCIVLECEQRYGGYSGWKNQISINLGKCSNSYEALDTLIHEENHAYQKQCIEENQGYTDGERALLKAENGIAYRQDGEAYYRQSLEIDSNNAGIKYLLEEQQRYQKDPAYAEYMSGRVMFYNVVTGDYTNNPQLSNDSEQMQILEAFSRGELNADEKQLAEICLENGNNSIKQEAISLSEQSKQVLYSSVIENGAVIQWQPEEINNFADDGLDEQEWGTTLTNETYDDGLGEIEEMDEAAFQESDGLESESDCKMNETDSTYSDETRQNAYTNGLDTSME